MLGLGTFSETAFSEAPSEGTIVAGDGLAAASAQAIGASPPRIVEAAGSALAVIAGDATGDFSNAIGDGAAGAELIAAAAGSCISAAAGLAACGVIANTIPFLSPGLAVATSEAAAVGVALGMSRGLCACPSAASGFAISTAEAQGQAVAGATAAATNTSTLPPFSFAWVPEGTPWSPALAREDEKVFTVEIEHSEGDFAMLTIDLINPRVGLLAAGRNLWTWLSWRDPTSGRIKPLFNGRLIGVPQDLHANVVRLQFVARPANYNNLKAALAENLKTPPYWDPIWQDAQTSTPDDVLEARSAAWHIDRVTLGLTISDICIGEDGPLIVSNHFYDSMSVSYGQTPLRRVRVDGTVTWTQEGTGELDLNRELVATFQAAGSPFVAPYIGSLTGDGLFNSWPQAGTSIGGGWSVSPNASIKLVDSMFAPIQTFVYTMPNYEDVTVLAPGSLFITQAGMGLSGYVWGRGWVAPPQKTTPGKIINGFTTYALLLPVGMMIPDFRLAWLASRDRSEQISFTLEADVQSILVDPGDAEETSISLTSSFIDQPIDPNGSMPIGDLRRNSYFLTDRGQRSFENLVMLARAKLLAAARAVSITFQMPFADGTDLSCRYSVVLNDPRLPGGTVAGKVTQYKLSADGSGKQYCEVTIGCSVGYGEVLTAAEGTDTYADDYADGYTVRIGQQVELPDVLYSFDGQAITDDGVDLFNVDAPNFLRSLVVTDGPDAQRGAILGGIVSPGHTPPTQIWSPFGNRYIILYGDVNDSDHDPTSILHDHPTKVSLEMRPIGGGSFATVLTPWLSFLSVPQTVDLEYA